MLAGFIYPGRLRGFSAILQQFYIFTGAASIAERGHLWYNKNELRIFGVKREWQQQTKP